MKNKNIILKYISTIVFSLYSLILPANTNKIDNLTCEQLKINTYSKRTTDAENVAPRAGCRDSTWSETQTKGRL